MPVGKRILVVDDEPDLCLLYQRALQAEGYEVRTAGNARQALEAMSGFLPDLVVMDIRMPGMDGIKAMGRMLNLKNDLPIILHTAYRCYQDNFLSWPASAYLDKSSGLSALATTVRELLDEPGAPRSISQAA